MENKCDICGKKIDINLTNKKIKIIENNEMKQIIKNGFNPFIFNLISLEMFKNQIQILPNTDTSDAKKDEYIINAWKDFFLNNDKSNWAICEFCYPIVARYQ
ncbi:MAG: hypothetical protein K9W44_14185 [Candidatus Lokiarchaeota archaeon]|nr:hypothetical protein [Candidatus Harpocratesius repetitus]